MASDRMVSMAGYFSGDDIARKVDPLVHGSSAMWAGNNISPVTPILNKIADARRSRPLASSLSAIVEVVRDAYAAQRLEQIQDEILMPIGLDWTTFKGIGREYLTEKEHENITASSLTTSWI